MRFLFWGSLALVACVGDNTVTQQDSGTDASVTDAPTDTKVSNDAGDAGDSAGPWTPAMLDTDGSLALWLDTDAANITISSGTVGKWSDLSHNHNDAINPSGGPTLDAKVINGHDGVHFSAHGVTMRIADAVSLQLSNDQFLIMAVAKASTAGLYFYSKATNGAGGGGTFYRSGLEYYEIEDTSDGGTPLVPFAHFAENVDAGGTTYTATWSGSVFDDGKFHIVGLRRPDSGTLVHIVDGLPVQSTSTGGYDVSEVGRDVFVGSVSYGTFNPPMDGEIAELIVVHETVIPDSVLSNLQTYLKAKYAL